MFDHIRRFVSLAGRPAAVRNGLSGLAMVVTLLSLAGPAPAAGQEAETEAEAEESAPVYNNFIRWTTASEVDNFGYHVYRGESEDGPYERLTEKPILGAGTTDQPSHYEFVDEGVDPYKTYWYYVESISMTGERERFSPFVRKKPKLEAEPAEAESGSGDEESGSEDEESGSGDEESGSGEA